MITPQNLADQIKRLELDVWKQQKEMEGLSRGITRLEHQEMDRVMGSTMGDGKRVFTNERQRKIEVDKRLSEDSTWLDLSAKVDAYKDAQKKSFIELDYKKRLFRIHEMTSRSGQ